MGVVTLTARDLWELINRIDTIHAIKGIGHYLYTTLHDSVLLQFHSMCEDSD